MATANKLTYLNTTKTQLKQMISYGYPLTNETFRQYVSGVFQAMINSMSDTLNPTWGNLPKISSTPATSLSINNTIEAPMRMELGSSALEQTTYTGKNLLNVPSNYSLTGNTQIPINIPANTEIKITLSSISLGGENKALVSIRDDNNQTVTFDCYFSPTDLSFTRTLTGNATKIYIYSQNSYNNSQGITTIFKNLMISTNGGEYEPYVGGTASPNPSYPQDIHSISGNNSVKVEGKNLLNNSSMTANTNCTITNQTITTSAVSNYATIRVNCNNIPLTKDTNYYVTFQAKKTSGSGEFNRYFKMFNGTNYTENLTASDEITNPSLTSEFQTYCFRFHTTYYNFIAERFILQVSSNASSLVLEIKDLIISQTANDTYTPYT